MFQHPLKILGPCLLAAALVACESPAGEVHVLTSDTTQVKPGSTFAWQARPADTPPGDPRVDNDIIRGRLKSAVETALAGRGFRQVSDPAQAQLLVSYHVGLRQQTGFQVSTFGGGGPTACGPRGCWGWGGWGAPTTSDVTPVDYVEGTLLLDLTDRGSGQLAWRAMSRRRVDSGDADQVRLNAMVADMTKSLPAVAASKPAG